MTIDRRNFLRAAGIGALAVTAPAIVGMSRKVPATKAMEPAAKVPAQAAKVVNRPPLVEKALAALDTHADRIARRDLVGVVDFSVHSSKPRFHLVDVASGEVRAEYLVAHGRGSDPGHSGYLKSFSNVEGSNATSRGAYLVSNPYIGKYGRSRRLVGLDPDNDLALDRAIVMHGADYVSPDLVASQGKIGRSFGCFSVERHLIGEVMDRLPEGCLLFADRV